MAGYYKPKLFSPGSVEPFKLSRSKMDLFNECPRCFYLDRRHGVSRPRGPAFTLNVAVDALLKKEFDTHRVTQTQHPLLAKYGVNAIPFKHKEMDVWRENFVGIQYLHTPTNLIIFGAVDDVWIDPEHNLIVVDYKATSKEGTIESLSDTKWEAQYKRQLEVYQWLLRRNGFSVSNTGYFVYVNGKKDRKAFDGKLEFDVTLIPHIGDDAWVEPRIFDMHACLTSEHLPSENTECEFCAYRTAAGTTIRSIMTTEKSLPKNEKPKRNAVSRKGSKDQSTLF